MTGFFGFRFGGGLVCEVMRRVFWVWFYLKVFVFGGGELMGGLFVGFRVWVLFV